MQRLTSGLLFLFTLFSVAPAFAEQEPPLGQQGLPVPHQGVQVGQPVSKVAGQGSYFDRVSTVRHEVTVSPVRAGQGAPSQRQSSSLGQSQSPSQPMSVRVRTTPHTFYPGMRGSQGPNMNVPQLGSPASGRAAYFAPGILPNVGGARASSARPRAPK
jgi:hypothetical protein